MRSFVPEKIVETLGVFLSRALSHQSESFSHFPIRGFQHSWSCCAGQSADATRPPLTSILMTGELSSPSGRPHGPSSSDPNNPAHREPLQR